MYRIILVTLFCLALGSAKAQYNTNWCFGNNAALTFKFGFPLATQQSALAQREGCATMSDDAGNLLFYTDGITVYNRNHVAMFNGTDLRGHFSSTQSAFIVPWLGNPGLYFLFCNDAQAGTNGTTYSIVDMNLYSGLGDIDTARKNIQLLKRSTEKGVAIMHSIDTAIWVVVHPYNSASYHAYKLTKAGLDTVPVVSTGGVYIGNNAVNGNCIGYLTASLDGTRLAAAHRHINRVETMDFNPATGVISNFELLDTNFLNFGPYGVEFSPNKNFLYVNESDANVYQYNLQDPNPAATRVIIAQAPNVTFDHFGAIQVGPDSILYLSTGNKNFLSKISFPDSAGNACGFVDTAVVLQSTVRSNFGLPKPIVGYRPVYNFSYLNTCFGDSTAFLAPPLPYDSLRWDFGDVLSGAANTSVKAAAKHLYTAPGIFQVSLTIYNGGVGRTYVQSVSINLYPVSVAKPDTLCLGQRSKLYVNGDYDRLVWSTGATSDTLLVGSSGQYWVTTFRNGCTNGDTVNVYFVTPPRFTLGADTTICFGDTVYLHVNPQGYKLQWQDGSASSTYMVTQPGIYTAQLTNGICTVSDSKSVQVEYCDFQFVLPNVFSPNQDGNNDVFKPVTIENITSLKIDIYNRWGTLVYTTTETTVDWLGLSLSGEPVADGVYFWTVDFTDYEGNPHRQSGIVTIFR